LPTPCRTCLPYLEEEHKGAVEVFMLAINNIQYSSMGKPMGLDMPTVIELVKLSEDKTPIETIEKVMHLSRELVRDGD
jgi:hypothetical protein